MPLIETRTPLLSPDPEHANGSGSGTPATPPTAPEGDGDAGDGASSPDGPDEPEAPKPDAKTFTQDDIDRIVAREKAKAKKSALAEIEAERKKAEMSDAEKAQARAKELEAELEKERASTKRERLLRDLTGMVVDADDALVIAERLELVDDDGKIDVAALLKAKPYLAPKQSGGDVDLPGSRSVKGQAADVAALEGELSKARTRTERIAIQRRIDDIKRGKR